jgi:hypothetical protein
MPSISTPTSRFLRESFATTRKSAAGLARRLRVPNHRVYTMMAGRRKLQPSEYEGTAAYLDTTVEKIKEALTEAPRASSAAFPRVRLAFDAWVSPAAARRITQIIEEDA